MGLESAFYIVGIVFMGLMLIILIAMMIAVLVIRAKIVAIHRTIENKLHTVTDVTAKAAELFRATKEVVGEIKRG